MPILPERVRAADRTVAHRVKFVAHVGSPLRATRWRIRTLRTVAHCGVEVHTPIPTHAAIRDCANCKKATA